MSLPAIGYSFPFGDQSLTPPPVQSTRNPTVDDTSYSPGQPWINTSNGNVYVLTSLTSSISGISASWTLLGVASGGALNTLTGGSGGAISPSSNNITLAGTSNEITTVGSGSTITFSVPSTFVAPGSITATLGNITATNGNLSLASAGNKVLVHASTSASDSVGTATLASGVKEVATTAVDASSLIFVSYKVCASANPCALEASYTSSGHFTITSQDLTDSTSTVNYWIIN